MLFHLESRFTERYQAKEIQWYKLILFSIPESGKQHFCDRTDYEIFTVDTFVIMTV